MELLSAIDEQGNYPHVAGQRSFDLDSHKIIGVFEPPIPLRVPSLKPLWPYHHQHYIAGCNLIAKYFDEIETEIYVVDVHK